jgi:ABC-type phosphate/phosphonate transport system permease subunit
MFTTDNLCLLFIVAIIAILIALVYMALRKIKLGSLSQGNVQQLMPQMARGWQTNWVPHKGKMTVVKDSFVATDIYLKNDVHGNMEILNGANAGTIGWVLVVILILFGGGFIGIILAIVLHVMSRNFAKKEIVPMISYIHTNPVPIPPYPAYPQYYPEPQFNTRR